MEDKPLEDDLNKRQPQLKTPSIYSFFSAILACYNNHWVLRTSPDDWWNVIVRVVAQAVDENGDKERVRSLFVDHEGKKDITIIVPHLGTVDYSWLFDQFSKGLREGCKIINLSFFGRFPNFSESIVYTSLLHPFLLGGLDVKYFVWYLYYMVTIIFADIKEKSKSISSQY